MSSAEREEGRGGEMEMSAACRLPSLLPFFSALFPCHCTNRAAQSGPCKRSSCTHRTALRCLLCLCVGDRRARRSGEQRSSCPRHTMRLFGSLSLPFSLSLSLSLSLLHPSLCPASVAFLSAGIHILLLHHSRAVLTGSLSVVPYSPDSRGRSPFPPALLQRRDTARSQDRGASTSG